MRKCSGSLLQRRAFAFPEWRAFAFSLFVLFLTAGIPSGFAADRVIEITNGAAEPGGSTTVSLRMNEPEGFAGGDFSIEYDPRALSIVDVSRTAQTDDFLVVDGNPSPGLLTISMAGVEGLPSMGPTDIVSIELQVLSGVQAGVLIPLTFRSAQWYDDNIDRQAYVGDNGLIMAGAVVPNEESLELRVGSVQGSAASMVDVPVTLSVAEGAASVAMSIEYDKTVLINPVIELGEALAGWEISTVLEEGIVSVSLSDSVPLTGVESVTLLNCSFYVDGDATPGSTIPITLSQGQVKNSHGFQFYAELADGGVEVEQEEATSTPTSLPTETPTPTFTQEPTDTPTFSPADFNEDGKIDQKDLMQFIDTWHEEAKQ